MFSSFILQSVLALIAFVTLLCFEVWSTLRHKAIQTSKETHADRVTIALIEFHKAQCYFSSVIQVTALSLFRQTKLALPNSDYVVYRWFDTSVLIVLATGGFIPTNLTLSCLTRYGRQSWYLLILSLITSSLATATLSASYYYAARSPGSHVNSLSYPFLDGTFNGNCVLGAQQVKSINDIVIPLCGNSDLLNNAMPK